MTLRDSIKADAFSVFLQTDEFAECVVYKFRNGGSRSIKAIIDREPPAIYDAAGNAVLPAFMVTIHNNATTGVCESEIDTGGDQVELKKEFGDTIPEDVSVMVVSEKDMGMLTLALK